MAPERNMTDASEKQGETNAHTGHFKEPVSSPPLDMADKQHDVVAHSHLELNLPKELVKESEVSCDTFLTSNRTESTATDDSGIAGEFEDQNLDEDNESVLGNSQNNGFKSCLSSCTVDNHSTPVNSPKKSDYDSLEVKTPHRHPSTEDEKPSPSGTRWWSPHRATCSESLDSIAEQRRKRSKVDITKRTAWLKERTETALEKSAVVRKRSTELIQTGKRLRNEEI